MKDIAGDDCGDGRLGTMVVAGHPYADYTRTISHAFSKIGYETTCVEYSIPRLNQLERLRMILSPAFRTEFNRGLTISNAAQIEEAVAREKPEFLVVMNGNHLTKTTLDICRSRNTRLAMWAYDSFSNFRWIGDVAGQYDLVFTYEPHDLAAFPTKRPVTYLPMAFDPEIYFPTNPGGEKHIDVFFAGAIRGNYPERTRRLRAIGAAFPDLNIRVIAPGTPLYSPFKIHDLLIAVSGNSTTVQRGWSSHEALNTMYNGARICINMHSGLSVSAANPRSFEILGSGGLLLTDRVFPHSEDLTPGREYLLYSSDGEMLESVRWLLDNPNDSMTIARRGHEAAMANHTYSHRATDISDMMRRVE